MPSRTLVLIPAYQKEKLLLNVISKMPKVVNEVLLVWDLPDFKSLEILRERVDKRVKLITRERRYGVGSAIMEGIQHALKYNFDNFIVMAGNGKDDPQEIVKFIYLLDKRQYDYVQGSRWIKGGVSENLPPIRHFIVKSLAFAWSLILGKKITEVTNGFRGFKVDVFRDQKIKWNLKRFAGYELEYYLNYAIIKEGYRHTEIGVSKRYVKNIMHSKIKLVHAVQILSPLILTPIYHYLFNKY